MLAGAIFWLKNFGGTFSLLVSGAVNVRNQPSTTKAIIITFSLLVSGAVNVRKAQSLLEMSEILAFSLLVSGAVNVRLTFMTNFHD